MNDVTGIAACLAEQLRLLGYIVLAPPATAPEPAPPEENLQAATRHDDTGTAASADSVPVRLQEEAQNSYEAETPPAVYDFTAYRDLFDNGRAYAGAPKHDTAGPPGGEKGVQARRPLPPDERGEPGRARTPHGV